MKINFYATLRPIVGQKTVDFDVPENVTVRQLVETIIILYPQTKGRLLDESGELHRHAHVYVNGRDTPYLIKTSDTVLTADDKVDIFPIGHF
ncbi:MAG: MoaD/ThiS family protein [Chloroflexi bacterium]|nr:MoaD/ThiS family protein [Chloroflexota bacterium]